MYFIVCYFVVPCLVACVSAVWFGVGGVLGLRRLFRDLHARKDRDVLDDGRVEGSVSLADRARFRAVETASDEERGTERKSP